MTAKQTAELKRIADRLKQKRNDGEALMDFQVLVGAMKQADRKALAQTLMTMIAETKDGR
ncbi:MAG TPA: hypothetical protein VNS88_05850 [Nitrospiraceae bacterium]|nr:hypothetical protein [Nitrospiraceae bacterium]